MLNPWQVLQSKLKWILETLVPTEELSEVVNRYIYFQTPLIEMVVYTIARPTTLTTTDELLAMLGGRFWFGQFELEASQRFNYIHLLPMSSAWGEDAYIGFDAIIDNSRLYLCVLKTPWQKNTCDWNNVAIKLAETINHSHH